MITLINAQVPKYRVYQRCSEPILVQCISSLTQASYSFMHTIWCTGMSVTM